MERYWSDTKNQFVFRNGIYVKSKKVEARCDVRGKGLLILELGNFPILL